MVLADWGSADLDGDGTKEWVLLVRVGEEELGAIATVDRDGRTRATLPVIDPGALWIRQWTDRDLDGDGAAELIVAWATSGAHTPTTRVAAWRGSPGSFTRLDSGIELAQATVTVRGHRRARIRLEGGIFNSAGAGAPDLQREATQEWAFDDGALTLRSSRWAPSRQRLHRIADGDRLWLSGDEAGAESAYAEALHSKRLHDAETVGHAPTAVAARQLAAVRLVQLALATGRPERVPGVLAASIALAAETPWARGGALVWEGWSRRQDLPQACSEAIEQASARGAVWILDDLGYASPRYDADALCLGDVGSAL